MYFTTDQVPLRRENNRSLGRSTHQQLEALHKLLQSKRTEALTRAGRLRPGQCCTAQQPINEINFSLAGRKQVRTARKPVCTLVGSLDSG